MADVALVVADVGVVVAVNRNPSHFTLPRTIKQKTGGSATIFSRTHPSLVISYAIFWES